MLDEFGLKHCDFYATKARRHKEEKEDMSGEGASWKGLPQRRRDTGKEVSGE